MGKASDHCYCAFCRSERVVYSKRHVSFIDIMLSLAAAFLLSFIIWQDFDPRLLLFFVFSVGIAEVFSVVRFRLSVACPRCGFDPVLYRKKPELAAAKVKAHYEFKRQDPNSLLTPPPKLPNLIKKTDRSMKRPPELKL